MADIASNLACRFAAQAEAICRHYLSNGRREGRYWLVGDVHNTPGRSLSVRLHAAETGRGAAGKWTDAAMGEYGDLLDLIATCNQEHGRRERSSMAQHSRRLRIEGKVRSFRAKFDEGRIRLVACRNAH